MAAAHASHLLSKRRAMAKTPAKASFPAFPPLRNSRQNLPKRQLFPPPGLRSGALSLRSRALLGAALHVRRGPSAWFGKRALWESDHAGKTVEAGFEVLPPRNAMALDTLAGVRGKMAKLLALRLLDECTPGTLRDQHGAPPEWTPGGHCAFCMFRASACRLQPPLWDCPRGRHRAATEGANPRAGGRLRWRSRRCSLIAQRMPAGL